MLLNMIHSEALKSLKFCHSSGLHSHCTWGLLTPARAELWFTINDQLFPYLGAVLSLNPMLLLLSWTLALSAVWWGALSPRPVMSFPSNHHFFHHVNHADAPSFARVPFDFHLLLFLWLMAFSGWTLAGALFWESFL